MPASPNRPFELRDGLVSEWSEFCTRYGSPAADLPTRDWLGGDAVDAPAHGVLRVTLERFPMLAEASATTGRPAVWCLYRVQTVPVRSKTDGKIVAQAQVPVPLSVGAARPVTVTQFPPCGLTVNTPLRFWFRGWIDNLPENHKWGGAVSTAAWIVTVSQQLRLPEAFDAA